MDGADAQAQALHLVTFGDGPQGCGIKDDPVAGTVVIASVKEGSQASAQGLQVGDILLDRSDRVSALTVSPPLQPCLLSDRVSTP